MKRILMLLFISLTITITLSSCTQEYHDYSTDYEDYVETMACRDCEEQFEERDLNSGLCPDCIEAAERAIEGMEPCYRCGLYYDPEDFFDQVHEGEYLCSDCAEEGYGYTCESCGLYEESLCEEDDRDKLICCVCLESVESTAEDNDEEYYEEEDSYSGQQVYVTKSGKKYHQDYCQHLSTSKIAISLSEAEQKGYGPCSKCG